MTYTKSLDLAPEGAWFKSSYSGGNGNNCLEVAWFKSSYSGNNGNSCVEVADLATRVGVRDSKQSNGPALTVTPAAWAAFVGYAKA
ncbi:DUF397 domain-containing protein [Streptomyces sp. NPDC094448]|uniref:DUF397 domain-containing protein n=1 Tax=Streptomyces sp. NPDC094448 TaxID=3366063 RepID=UPI0038217832